MQYFKRFAIILITVSFFFPSSIGAAGNTRSFSGTVTNLSGSQIFVKTPSAAVYNVDIGNATLLRRNGAVMQMTEILVGDKVEVKGTLFSDGSMSATYVRNISLYVHNSTFTGKITSINPSSREFVLQSKTYGTQVIKSDNFTIFKQNGTNSALSALELGVTATVKGSWDRSYATVIAKEVKQTVRLVGIEITGQLVMKTDTGLTVIANNVIYGVDTSKAKLLSKNNKGITYTDLTMGGQVKITGKHISERATILAGIVKDLTLVK